MKDTYKEELELLKESNLSWSGKMFFAAVATYLSKIDQNTQDGELPKLPIKLKGSEEQIQAIMDVISSSRDFQKELSKPDATIESAIQKLNTKNEMRKKFEQVFGFPWPL